MYSLSTCWNSHRHTDGRAMLQEIRALGFDQAELSHGIRISLLPGILDAVEAGEIRISSLHNFCPLPVGVNHAAPNLYQFSARKERERESAFRHTVRTLELAARLKAPVVVLHCGSIDMGDFTDDLVALIDKGRRDDPAYARLLAKALAKRDKGKAVHLERAQAVLKRIVDEAEKLGVRLGVECREALEELPLESELEPFLNAYPSATVGYWHDTGHAQIKENLGLLPHAEGLARVAHRLLGFHLHDVVAPARDHCPPGMGCVDFTALKPMIRPEHIKVFEIHPSVPAADLQRGVQWLKELWDAA
jgi:sugar phosphate isomerase/epimerase